MIRTSAQRMRRTACAAAVAGAIACAGTATAAAAPTAPLLSPITVRSIPIAQQTPTVGITLNGALPTGGFIAQLAIAAVGTDTTAVWLRPMPPNACVTSLRTATVAVTWRNLNTRAVDDVTFAACDQGEPAVSPILATGLGRLQLTVSVLGAHRTAITLSPGTALVDR
ncbi:MAG: hypothetical protein QM662_13790 [Gordonia sp. (in: high G+C Gram-positive bacteria)]